MQELRLCLSRQAHLYRTDLGAKRVVRNRLKRLSGRLRVDLLDRGFPVDSYEHQYRQLPNRLAFDIHGTASQ